MRAESLLFDPPSGRTAACGPPDAGTERAHAGADTNKRPAPAWDSPHGGPDRPPIVDVLHLVHSLTGGGTERTLAALLQHVPSDRVRHAVVTLRAAGPLAARLPDHVAVHALERGNGASRCGSAIARIARRRSARILHARNTGCWADALAACARLPGMGLVLGFHGLEHDGPFNRRQRWMILAGRCLGATFACVSESGRRLLLEAGAPARRIRLIPNGVDLARFAPGDSRAREQLRRTWGWSDRTVGIVAVGSLTPVKGLDILLKSFAAAAQSCHNMALSFVGDGPLRNSLGKQADDAGVGSSVTLAGVREDMPSVYAAADIVACSSRAESLSNALLEAMASHRPIISTRVGDHAEVLGEGASGVLVAPGDAEALAGALVRLVRDPAERARLARVAGNAASRHDFGQTLLAYHQLYEELLAGSAKCEWVQ